MESPMRRYMTGGGRKERAMPTIMTEAILLEFVTVLTMPRISDMLSFGDCVCNMEAL